MERQITESDFEALREQCGSHSAAAEALGLTPNYYTSVRTTGRVSKTVAKLIRALLGRGNPTNPDAA